MQISEAAGRTADAAAQNAAAAVVAEALMSDMLMISRQPLLWPEAAEAETTRLTLLADITTAPAVMAEG